MIFRKANKEDIETIVKMYNDGAESLKRDNVDQWQDEKPSKEELEKVIDEVYVLEHNGPVSTCRLMSYDKQYNEIYKGSWLTSSKSYYAIHRVATLEERKRSGYAEIMFKKIEILARENEISSLKVDTHHENKKMQKFLRKNGYSYCGEIILENAAKRDAFEKTL